MAQNKSDTALNAFDRWFAGEWQNDHALAEVSAQLEDSACAVCSDEFFRLQAARAAQLVPTGARTARVTEVRDRIVANLVYCAKPGETPLAHVQRLRALGEVAAKSLAVAGDDSELKGKARAAVTISWPATPGFRPETEIVNEVVRQSQ